MQMRRKFWLKPKSKQLYIVITSYSIIRSKANINLKYFQPFDVRHAVCIMLILSMLVILHLACYKESSHSRKIKTCMSVTLHTQNFMMHISILHLSYTYLAPVELYIT